MYWWSKYKNAIAFKIHLFQILLYSQMVSEINIQANRRSKKYTHGEQAKRVLWMALKPFFRWSPRPFFGWRRFLLRRMGARIGAHVHIYSSAVIYFPWNLTIGNNSSIGENALIYNLGPIVIGENATVSQRAHLCAGTHDYKRKDMLLEKPPIVLGNQVWICADAFIGPNVTVSDGAVVAACAVVVKDVAPWSVVGGNPARHIKQRMILA